MAVHYRKRSSSEEKRRKDELRRRCISLAVSSSALLVGLLVLFFSAFLVQSGSQPASFYAYVPSEEEKEEVEPPDPIEPIPYNETPGGVVNPVIELVSQAPAAKMDTVDLGDTGIVSDLAIAVDYEVGDLGSGQAAGDASLGEQAEGDGSGGEGAEGGGEGTGGGTGGNGEGSCGLGTTEPGGSTLQGTFYDLKLTAGGKASPFQDPNTGGHNTSRRTKLADVYHRFLQHWSRDVLEPYYTSRTKLYASHFYLPNCDAGYGPYAFRCDPKIVKAQTWMAIYRGKVIAPKTAKFRFVGTGDDIIAVRFNGETVLEAGWAIPSRHNGRNDSCFDLGSYGHYQENIRRQRDRSHKDYDLIELPKDWEWNKVGGLTSGTPFKVKEGESYPIEILISEIPGGRVGFVLFIEDMDDRSRWRIPTKKRTYDLFRTNEALPDKASIEQLLEKAGFPEGNLQCPPYNPNSPIWRAIPEGDEPEPGGRKRS